MMGLLLSAMAGAGDAGVQSMNQEIEQLGRQDLLKQQTDAQLQSAQALEKYKFDLADQMRQRDADTLATARTAEEERILQGKVKAARDPAAGAFDPATITPEERIKHALDDKERVLALTNAGLSTGQLGVKDAATLAHRDSALEAQMTLKLAEIDLRQARNDALASKNSGGAELKAADGLVETAKNLQAQLDPTKGGLNPKDPQYAKIQERVTTLMQQATAIYQRTAGLPTAAAGTGVPNSLAFDRDAAKEKAAAPSSEWTKKLVGIAEEEGLTPAQTRFFRAMTRVESSDGKDPRVSVDGAIGPGQMLKDTFEKHKRPGMDNIQDADHNLHAAARYIKYLGTKAGDDIDRLAVGYQSGYGNINTSGATPWINNPKDGLGTSVADYVALTQQKLAALDKADAAPAAKPVEKPAPKALPPELQNTDVAARADAAEKKRLWEEESEKARVKKLKDDSAGVTVAVAQELSPEQARTVLEKYREVLPADVKDALQRRLPRYRPRPTPWGFAG